MNDKPLIVWDFDDVLFPLTEAWFSHVGRKFQTEVKAYDQIVKNPPLDIMGISLDEYLESLDTFRNSEIALNIEPKKVILNWFAVYGSAYRNEVLTARPLNTLDIAKEWLSKHLPNYFQGFGFVPSARPGIDISGYPKSKRAFLEKEGMSPQFLIDDKAATIDDVSQMPGVKAILYPAPWNEAYGKSPDPQKLMNGAAHDQAL
jgi:hypothetical protein